MTLFLRPSIGIRPSDEQIGGRMRTGEGLATQEQEAGFRAEVHGTSADPLVH